MRSYRVAWPSGLCAEKKKSQFLIPWLTLLAVWSLFLSVSPCVILLIQLIHGIVVMIAQSFGCNMFQKQKA